MVFGARFKRGIFRDSEDIRDEVADKETAEGKRFMHRKPRDLRYVYGVKGELEPLPGVKRAIKIKARLND